MPAIPWPIETHPITELKLDQGNIRTPISEKDQSALIRDMFDNENAFAICRSYSLNGVFPDEFPIGVKDGKRYIIIEGNRRLAALVAFANPEIVPQWKKRIEALENPNITEIRIVIAPTRDAAIKHIANKHTVNLLRPWKPLRQAYFYQSQIDAGATIEDLKRDYPQHENIPRFIRMLEMHHLAKSIKLEDDVKPRVDDERQFPITNLERFYDDDNVNKFLGIEFDGNGKVTGHIKKSEFEKGYSKIVTDVATREIDSRTHNTTTERKDYLAHFPATAVPDKSKKGSFGTKDFKPIRPTKKAAAQQQRSKRQPKGLFHATDMPYRLKSAAVRIVYEELRQIDVAKFPNATHDLLRSFLEGALAAKLKQLREYSSVPHGKNKSPTLGEMLTFIENGHSKLQPDRSVKGIITQVKSGKTMPHSLEHMNMSNHNESWVTTEKDVRAGWAKLQELVRLIISDN